MMFCDIEFELMCIGRFGRDRDKESKEESVKIESSGPTLRMMSKGKRLTDTTKKRQKRYLFERGERGG